MIRLIGNELVEKMIADASSRKATSLSEMASKVTLSMIKQDIENLKDDPETLKQQLYIYAQHAKDPEVLRFFASHEDEDVRYEITNNKNIPEDVIRQFAQDKNPLIRAYIAGRNDLPEDIIGQLAQDKSASVRSSLNRSSHSDLHGFVEASSLLRSYINMLLD